MAYTLNVNNVSNLLVARSWQAGMMRICDLIGSNRTNRSLSPKIEAERMKDLSLYVLHAVVREPGNEFVDLARLT